MLQFSILLFKTLRCSFIRSQSLKLCEFTIESCPGLLEQNQGLELLRGGGLLRGSERHINMSYLQVGLVLDKFLCTTVKQPNVGVTFLDRFPAELQDEAQHTVSCWMLRPKVDSQVGHVLFSGRIFVCR